MEMKAGSETVGEYKAKVKRDSTCARLPVMKLDVPDARTAAPSLSRMRLHHPGPQPASARARGATSSAATPAATRRRPTAYCRQFNGDRELRGLPAAIDDPRVDAVVVAVPPRFHLDLTLQALAAGKHVLVEKPAFLRMADYRDGRSRRGTGPDASCSSARTITTSRWRSRCAGCSPTGRDRRDGVRALHDDRQAAEDGRRLAQRRSDGRRRRVLRGRDPLAPSGRQPRPDASRRFTAIGRRRRATGPDTRAQEHDGRVPLRQRRGRVAVLLARDPVALQRAAALEDVRARRHHHVRVERLVRRGPGHAAVRGSCSRASATSAAIRRCTATSSGRSGQAALRR